MVGPAAHGHRNVEPAGADGQHADAAAGGGVAVRAQQRLSRFGETLQVHLMADAVAGPRKPDAVLFGHGRDVLVVVCIFKAGLQHVVVDIGHRAFGLDAVDAHGLELQIGHGAGGVLRERLVNAHGDLLARLHLPGHKVRCDQFFCDVHLLCFPLRL